VRSAGWMEKRKTALGLGDDGPTKGVGGGGNSWSETGKEKIRRVE